GRHERQQNPVVGDASQQAHPSGFQAHPEDPAEDPGNQPGDETAEQDLGAGLEETRQHLGGPGPLQGFEDPVHASSLRRSKTPLKLAKARVKTLRSSGLLAADSRWVRPASSGTDRWSSISARP